MLLFWVLILASDVFDLSFHGANFLIFFHNTHTLTHSHTHARTHAHSLILLTSLQAQAQAGMWVLFEGIDPSITKTATVTHHDVMQGERV